LFVALEHPEALTEPEELLKAYFNSTNIGLCLFDSGFRYLAINRTLAAIHGLPVEAHLAKTVREVLGDLGDLLEPKFQQAIETKKPIHFEISGMLPSQTEKGHWIVHYLPVQATGGRVTRVGAVVLDVTAQKKMEESLQTIGGQLRQETTRLHVLRDVSSLLSRHQDISEVFPKISARLRRVLRQEFASLAIREENTDRLVYELTDFPLGKGLMSDHFATSNSPQGQALHAREAMIFTTMQEFENESTKGLLDEGLRSLCCVPLMSPKGPMGVVVLGSTRPTAFKTDDLELINQVAAQLAIAIENHRAATEIEELKKRLGEERSYLASGPRIEGRFPEIIGQSPALKRVLDQVQTVSASEATTLISGDTGTGKELIAHAIHRLSPRTGGPFVKLNCAAIPTGLLESELFGHEKGAFTGAIMRKIGRMELAEGGTLFLDEVGEIPLELQPKLLRVLQEQEFERLGSVRTIKVNLRIIAATNRRLEESVARHEFRSDLYYRLHVFPIRLPSLRERSDDIPLLIRHFVHKYTARMDRQIETIPKDTMKVLCDWSWPGNVRELENLMERSVILTEGSALQVPLAELRLPHRAASEEKDRTLDEAEKLHIIRILRETRGVLSGPNGAARRLGLKRTTLQSKIQRLGIKRDDYKQADD